MTTPTTDPNTDALQTLERLRKEIDRLVDRLADECERRNAAEAQRTTLLRIALAAWELSDTLRYSAPPDATDALDDLLMHAFANDADEAWQAAGVAIRAALGAEAPHAP